MKKNIANIILGSVVLITIGLLLMARNSGAISDSVFGTIVCWQTLLIVLGIDQFLRWKPVPGTILVLVGAIFLVPEILSVEPWDFVSFWPLIFIIVGLAVLLKLIPCSKKSCNGEHKSNNQYVDGHINSEISFASATINVTSTPFKGGVVKNSFGSTTINMKDAVMDGSSVTLSVDCSFGQLIISVPDGWRVRSLLAVNFAGFNDSRSATQTEPASELVLTGNVSFGNVEVK